MSVPSNPFVSGSKEFKTAFSSTSTTTGGDGDGGGGGGEVGKNGFDKTAASPPPASSSHDASNAASQAAIKKINAAGKDLYKVLDIPKSADLDVIKKAYRQLAMLVHPDRCQLSGATEAFKLVGNAYGCLSDDQKRNIYDKKGGKVYESDDDDDDDDDDDYYDDDDDDDDDDDYEYYTSSRGRGGGRSGGYGRGGRGRGGFFFDPDEIFRQFFFMGGGMGRGMGGGFDDDFGFYFGGGGGGGGGYRRAPREDESFPMSKTLEKKISKAVNFTVKAFNISNRENKQYGVSPKHASELKTAERDLMYAIFVANMSKFYKGDADLERSSNEGKMKETLFKSSNRFFIVYSSDKMEILAYANVCYEANDDKRPEHPVIVLNDLQVASGCQSKGIGFGLLKSIKGFGTTLEMKKIVLKSFKANKRASTFFAHLGFDVDENFKGKFGRDSAYEIRSFDVDWRTEAQIKADEERHARKEQARLARLSASEKAEKELFAMLEKERLEKAEKDRLAKEKKEKAAEKDRLAKEKRDIAAAAKAESDRLAKIEADRLAAEKAEKKRVAKAEADPQAAEKAEKARLAKIEAEQLAKLESDRLAAEKERLARDKIERERLAKLERERLAKLEVDRLAAEKAEKERLAREKIEREKLAKIEVDRLAAEKAEKEKLLVKEKADRNTNVSVDDRLAKAESTAHYTQLAGPKVGGDNSNSSNSSTSGGGGGNSSGNGKANNKQVLDQSLVEELVSYVQQQRGQFISTVAVPGANLSKFYESCGRLDSKDKRTALKWNSSLAVELSRGRLVFGEDSEIMFVDTGRLERERLAKIEAERLEKERLAKVEADRLEKEQIKRKAATIGNKNIHFANPVPVSKQLLVRMTDLGFDVGMCSRALQAVKNRSVEDAVDYLLVHMDELTLQAEADRISREKIAQLDAERAAAEKAEAERLAKIEADRIAAEAAERERLAKVEKDRLKKAEQERIANMEKERAAKLEAERVNKIEQFRLAQAEVVKIKLGQEAERKKVESEKKGPEIAGVEKGRQIDKRPPCIYFKQGQCRDGDKCKFSHANAAAPSSSSSSNAIRSTTAATADNTASAASGVSSGGGVGAVKNSVSASADAEYRNLYDSFVDFVLKEPDHKVKGVDMGKFYFKVQNKHPEYKTMLKLLKSDICKHYYPQAKGKLIYHAPTEGHPDCCYEASLTNQNNSQLLNDNRVISPSSTGKAADLIGVPKSLPTATSAKTNAPAPAPASRISFFGGNVCEQFIKGECKNGSICMYSHATTLIPPLLFTSSALPRLENSIFYTALSPVTNLTSIPSYEDAHFALNVNELIGYDTDEDKNSKSTGDNDDNDDDDDCFLELAQGKIGTISTGITITTASGIAITKPPSVHSKQKLPRKPCLYFKQGKCRDGDKCKFSHSVV